MKLKSQYLAYSLVAISTLISFQNCGQSGSVAVQKDSSVNSLCQGDCSQVTPVDVPPVNTPPSNTPPSNVPPGVAKEMTVTPYNDYVCEPFGSVYAPSLQGGLKAKLAYLDTSVLSDTEIGSYKVMDYFNVQKKGVNIAPQDLFFSQINTPTRDFALGFQTDDGNFLKNKQGDKLVEWFGVQYESVLKLSSNNQAGWYQISSLTDDGSNLDIWENDAWVKLVANDGVHANKIACASRAVYLDSTTRLKIRESYFQGPRVRISNMLHWKYFGANQPSTSNLGDSECLSETVGGRDDAYYFVNSVPQTPYQNFLKRGWKVIAAENFELPDKEINPCSSLTENWISASTLVVPVSSSGTADVVLKTTQPMKFTAQIYWLDSSMQKHALTSVTQPNMATTHTINITGIDIERVYLVEVVFENTDYKLKKQFLLKKTL